MSLSSRPTLQRNADLKGQRSKGKESSIKRYRIITGNKHAAPSYLGKFAGTSTYLRCREPNRLLDVEAPR